MTKAVDITGKGAPNGERTVLAEVIPLDTPMVVQVFDIYACNLRCKFCHYGLPEDKRPKLTDKNVMELSVFKKLVDDLKAFPQKVKMFRFCGAGESLLDANIAEMISYVSREKVAEKIELITNGILLTEELSEKILDAGLERIKFSVYGIDERGYQEICRRNIDFQQLLANIKYFYKRRNEKRASTRIYIKSMDCCLNGPEEENIFKELFAPYCDVIAIEKVRPNVIGVDYSDWINSEDKYNVMGIELPEINVCPQPYHLITVRPDGKIVPCQVEMMEPVGDITENSLKEIWQGKKLRKLQRDMLDGHDKCGRICAACELAQCRPFKEDILDADVERLKGLFDSFK